MKKRWMLFLTYCTLVITYACSFLSQPIQNNPLPTSQDSQSTSEDSGTAISWTTPLPELDLAKLTTSSILTLQPVGRLGRGISFAISQSPQGNQIAIATTAGVSIVDLSSFREVLYIDEKAQATSVSYSPDGSQLAVGLGDGRVVVYDSKSGEVVREIEYIRSIINWESDRLDWKLIVVFGPDGKSVLVSTGSSLGGTPIDLLDLETGIKRFSVPNPDWTLCLDYDSNNRYILVCSEKIYLLNAATGEVSQTIDGFDGSVRDAKFNPDARTLAIATEDNGIYIWDLETQSVTKQVSNDQLQISTLRHIDFGPDSNQIIFGGEDGYERYNGSYNIESDQLEWLVQSSGGSDGNINALEFSIDPKMVISGRNDGYLVFLDSVDGREIMKLRLGHQGRNVGNIAFSSDGSILAAGYDDSIHLWRIPSGKLQKELVFYNRDGVALGGPILAFHPNNTNLASYGAGDGISIWNIKNASLDTTIYSYQDIVRSLTFIQDGKTLVSGGDGDIWLINLSDDEKIIEFPAIYNTHFLAVNPNGSLLAFPSWKNGVYFVTVYDVESGQIVQEFARNEDRINGISFNANGKLLASADDSGTIIIWDIANGDEVFRFDGSGSAVNGLAFSSSDEWLLASSGQDGMLRLWNIKDGVVILELNAVNTVNTTEIEFSPDGYYLAIGSSDGTIRLWGVPK